MEEIKFKTGQEVLVRDNDRDNWCYSLYSHNQKDDDNNIWYVTVSDSWFKQCIPYKGNEYLVGTTNNPKGDLPFNAIVIVGNKCTTNGWDWNIRYYKGNNKVGNTKISSESEWYSPTYIIPYDKFDLSHPENSLKYKLVK